MDKWKKRKSREAKGLDPPFDVEAFEARLERRGIEKQARRQRRDRKRERLHLFEQISDSEDQQDEDSSSDEATERDEVAEYKGTSRPPVKLPVKSDCPKVPVKSGKNTTPTASPTSSAAVPPSKSMPPTRAAPPAKSVTTNKSVNTNKSATSSSDSDAPLAARQQKSGDGRIPKISNRGGTTNLQSKPSTPRGMGAVRGKSNFQNVFARRSPPKKRGQGRTTLSDVISDPTKGKSHFKNMHLVRKAELVQRDKADGAPDVDAVGGLFRPGDTPQLRPLRPARKISDTFPQARSFEDENESEADRPVLTTDTFTAPPVPFPKRQTTCFYWHSNKGISGACDNGFMCDYMHEYRVGHPIAPQPIGKYREENPIAPRPVDKQPQVQRPPERYRCFFFVKRGSCKLGDECFLLHSYDESIPVAPQPGVTSEPCQYWLNGYCNKSAEDCPRFHGNPDDIHAPTQGDFEKPSNFQEQPTVRKEKVNPICNRYLATGHCKFGLKCHFRHERLEPEPEPQPEPTKREVPKKSVSFATGEPMDLFEEPLPIASDEANQLEQAQDNGPPPPPPSAEDSTTSKPKRNKISFGDYTRKKAFNDGARAKKFTFGGDRKISLVLDIGDLGNSSQEPCGMFLSSTKDIILDQKIMAQDLKAQFLAFHKRKGSLTLEGNLSPRNDNDSEESKVIDKVVNYVRLHVCGLVCSSQGFNIIVFPARSNDWKFLGQSTCPNDVRLKYLVFKTDLNTTACLNISTPNPPISQKATAMNHRITITEIVHRLDIDRIAPLNEHRRYAFFLLFPDTADKTANFVANWLKQSRSGCKVYTSDDRGAWNFFLKTDTFNNGGIILHDSLTPHVDLIPHVQKTLLPSLAKNKQYSWWSISDGFQHPDIFPDTHEREEKDRGPLEAIPLLPHGAVILLTQSFFVAEPQKAYEILRWFFGRVDNDRHKPGKMGVPSPWKMVLPYNIIKYTHDLACAKDIESTKFLEENRDKPSREADASRRGLGYSTCELRFKIYAYLANLKRLGIIDNPKHIWPHYCVNGGEVRDEFRSPVIYAPKWVYTHDEIDFVYWFASWNIQRIDTYRKIVVVGTNSLSRYKLTRLVEVPLGTDVPEEPGLRNASQSSTPFEPPAAVLNVQETKPQNLEPPINHEKQKALAVAAQLNESNPSNAESTTKAGQVDENSSKTFNQGDLDVDAQILELIGNESSKHPQTSQLPRLSTSNLNSNDATSPTTASAQPQFSPQYSPQFSANSTSEQPVGPGADNNTANPTTKAPVKFAIPSKPSPMPDSKTVSAATTPSVSATLPKEDGAFQDEWQAKKEPAMWWKEKTYEHTTSWFRNMKASPERNGILWEQIYVGSWDMVWPYLGVKPT